LKSELGGKTTTQSRDPFRWNAIHSVVSMLRFALSLSFFLSFCLIRENEGGRVRKMWEGRLRLSAVPIIIPFITPLVLISDWPLPDCLV
jgi:heme/copper-type cytochrome/quinol oxidase subunit 2